MSALTPMQAIFSTARFSRNGDLRTAHILPSQPIPDVLNDVFRRTAHSQRVFLKDRREVTYSARSLAEQVKDEPESSFLAQFYNYAEARFSGMPDAPNEFVRG